MPQMWWMGAWMERLCNEGKCGLGEDPRGVRAQGKQERPRKRSSINKDKVALKELYHNPDPLQINSKLGLEIKQLDTLLDLEPAGGGQVPYNGYVELRMRVPNVCAFDLDVLMLVIPESEYSCRVPITISTIHIDEIIYLITDEELKTANRQ